MEIDTTHLFQSVAPLLGAKEEATSHASIAHLLDRGPARLVDTEFVQIAGVDGAVRGFDKVYLVCHVTQISLSWRWLHDQSWSKQTEAILSIASFSAMLVLLLYCSDLVLAQGSLCSAVMVTSSIEILVDETFRGRLAYLWLKFDLLAPSLISISERFLATNYSLCAFFAHLKCKHDICPQCVCPPLELVLVVLRLS